MTLLNVFDVSGSAMSAQSLRLNAIASNIANADSVADRPEDTYRARYPVFATMLQSSLEQGNSGTEAHYNAGVTVPGIVESERPLNLRYEPGHPQADEAGYVTYPNVSVVEEMANMISASRAFQVNVEMMNTAKTMAERVLNMGQ